MKNFALSLLILGVLVFVAGDAFAGADGEVTILKTASMPGTDAGEFEIKVVSGDWGEGGAGTKFRSFCLEQGESILADGTTVYCVDVNKYAQGDDGTQNTISNETAYLYYNYRQGTLVNGYSDTDDEANGLQRAIWFFEGQMGDPSSTDSYAKAYIAEAKAAAWTSTGLVWALNPFLVDSAGDRTDYQSQLTLVPLPASAALGFALLGSLGVFSVVRRRRRQD